jgi:predicted ATPase
MFITRVWIEHFKRFERMEIDLRPFDCLVGPNNSGKTTLLQALALFDFCLHECLTKRNGRLEARNRSISVDEFYVLPVSSAVELWTDRKTVERTRHRVIRIRVQFGQQGTAAARVDLSYNRFSVRMELEDTSQEWLQSLHGVHISYLPVFSTFLPQEERRTPAVIADELARGRVNAVIRNLLLDLKAEKRDAQLTEILRRAFPVLEDLTIVFEAEADRYISVTYREQGRPKKLDVFSAGSGFQQFLYLFGFTLLRQPTVVLLDEPDVHLHGSLQRVLIEELQRMVSEGRQVLFATHSRDVIERVSPENILSLEESGVSRLQVSSAVYDVLDRLGSLDLAQLPVIQVYRRVVVVEDKSDWELLSVFCSKVVGPSAWQQIERRVAVCYSKGNPRSQDMSRLRDQLQQVVSVRGRPLHMFVIADRDYYPDLEYLNKRLPTEHIRWHVWERAEIENYLLCLAAIRRTVSQDDVQMDIFSKDLEQEFERLVESSRDAANDRLVKAFQEYSRDQDESWDAVTFSRNAREYLQQHWPVEKLALADAKDTVLPGLKGWLQSQRLGQFSNKALADLLQPDELPPEIHGLADSLREFAGIEGGRRGATAPQ